MPRGVPLPDLTGESFGKLTVVSQSENSSKSGKLWICECECGNITTATSSVLVNKKKISCGCAEKDWVRQNLSGQVFGNFTVIKDIGSNKHKSRLYECVCVCGKSVNRTTYQLKGAESGKYKNHCGCLTPVKELETKERATSHGMSGSPTYNVWANMCQRTTNPNRPDFVHYGGRGITVCDRWLESFENFYEDMGEKPDKLSLERLNVDEGYTLENCIWADETTQNYHQRVRKDNSSGVVGVTFADGFWISRLWKNKTVVHYSRHSDFEDAVLARKSAELEFYGYEKSR